MYELFSDRLKRHNGEIDVFEYNVFPPSFRNQLFYIFSDLIKPFEEFNPNFWDEVELLFCREKGLKHMGHFPVSSYHGKENIECYISECDNLDLLDFIDYYFNLFDLSFRDLRPEDNPIYDADGTVSDAIKELNDRLKQHNLGYEFIDSQLIRIDNTLIHKEIVKPALNLLSEEGFEGAEDEIIEAFEARRKGDNKNAILNSCKSFESTMKTICEKNGYAYTEKDAAKNLINILADNEFFPKYMSTYLQNLKNILESGTPVIRNKQAGHGQGTEVVEPSNEFTDYAIHLAATNILFLVNLYKENL